jgi:chemotaxis protein MotB
MSDDDCPKCEEGLPPWLATFADLMSLLMCFFVLLLSFATVDAVRFKKMAESMKDAFGVQREIPASEIVQGISVIKQEWSPTVAEQSAITEIRQETSDVEQEHLKMEAGETDDPDALPPVEEAPPVEEPPPVDEPPIDDKTPEEITEELRELAIQQAQQELEDELDEITDELQDLLEQEVTRGMVSLERKTGSIIIRIQEKGSFPSGSARLDPAFHEVMARISAVLAEKPGRILVSGHTDNIPISTGRFRSNWELSSARAVTVLHSMLRNKNIDEDRITVQGFADTQPLADNDSPQNRARNRRVELILEREIDDNFDDLEELNFN